MLWVGGTSGGRGANHDRMQAGHFDAVMVAAFVRAVQGSALQNGAYGVNYLVPSARPWCAVCALLGIVGAVYVVLLWLHRAVAFLAVAFLVFVAHSCDHLPSFRLSLVHFVCAVRLFCISLGLVSTSFGCTGRSTFFTGSLPN